VNMATRKAHFTRRNSGGTTLVSVPYHRGDSLDAYRLLTFSLCLCTPNGFTWRRYSIILYVCDREKYLHLPDELHRRCPHSQTTQCFPSFSSFSSFFKDGTPSSACDVRPAPAPLGLGNSLGPITVGPRKRRHHPSLCLMCCLHH